MLIAEFVLLFSDTLQVDTEQITWTWYPGCMWIALYSGYSARVTLKPVYISLYQTFVTDTAYIPFRSFFIS